jgi:hypothetical protein
MALNFPIGPTVGDLYPADPGVSGVTQYQWDGAKWNAVVSTVSLGSPNQGVFNAYNWPATDGPAGYQLQTDGAGNLSWSLEADSSIQAIGLYELIDGVSKVYTLVKLGTNIFFTPNPSNNIVVFLGGVPQIPTAAYSVAGNQITFVDPPLIGTTFYAISNIVI